MKKFLSTILVLALALTFTAGLAEANDEGEFDVAGWLESVITEAYMGALQDGTTAYFAFGEDEEDGAVAVLVFMDPNQEKSASFVGQIVDNDDGTCTIEDYWNGLAITIGVQKADGGYLIDLGELGSGAVVPADIGEIINAFQIIQEGTEAVA